MPCCFQGSLWSQSLKAITTSSSPHDMDQHKVKMHLAYNMTCQDFLLGRRLATYKVDYYIASTRPQVRSLLTTSCLHVLKLSRFRDSHDRSSWQHAVSSPSTVLSVPVVGNFSFLTLDEVSRRASATAISRLASPMFFVLGFCDGKHLF